MTQENITFDLVAAAAEDLRSSGKNPSVRLVREALGGVPPKEVVQHLRVWKEQISTAAQAAPAVTTIDVDPSAAQEADEDNAAVDAMASAMKARLAEARASGRLGGQLEDPQKLSQNLRDCIAEHDPIDVANFCLHLFSLGARIPQVLRSPTKAQPAPANWVAALHEAVSALYFEDSSDYSGALYQVVKRLDPFMAETLARSTTQAYAHSSIMLSESILQDSVEKNSIVERKPCAIVGFDAKSWRDLMITLVGLPEGTPLYARPDFS